MKPKPSTNQVELTVYCGRVGDHNDLAMQGAASVGKALSERLGISATIIGTPQSALDADWKTELDAAMPALFDLAEHLNGLFNKGHVPVLALSRCAASLATLPIVMRHRPDSCVIWFDAHGDMNTPQTTLTNYLGGMALAGPAGLWDSGLGNGLPLANIILVGARDLDPAEWELVDSGRLMLIPLGNEVLKQLRSAINGRRVYVHLDCDVLEPGFVPTDYKVSGGFSLTELHAICKVLAEFELIGLEIAEFENVWPGNGKTASPVPLLEALDPLISRLATNQ